MTMRARLTVLEHQAPKTVGADRNAKKKLLQHIQKLADRSESVSKLGQQQSEDWLLNEWPKHLERIRGNAVR
jgi:hypothetical protein